MKEGCANPSSCTGQLDCELHTAQHSHQRIELRDARDAVRQPELRSQFVRWGEAMMVSGDGKWSVLTGNRIEMQPKR